MIDVLSRVGLTRRLGKNPLDVVVGTPEGLLSGGERQRLALARALLDPAPVLIVDEPTSAADPLTAATIREILQQESTRRSVVVITHHLEAWGQDIPVHVIDQGRIVETGKHHELLARDGLYAHHWGTASNAKSGRIPL